MRGLRESRVSRNGTRIRRFAKRGKKGTKNLWDWVVNGSHCNLCALALGLALYISYTALISPEQGGNSCPLLRSCFIGSFHVDVSKCLSRSLLFDFTSFLSSSVVDFTLVAFIVCRPLQFLVSHINYTRRSRIEKKLGHNVNTLSTNMQNNLHVSVLSWFRKVESENLSTIYWCKHNTEHSLRRECLWQVWKPARDVKAREE